MTTETPKKPHVLIILDGWGHREICEDNAICLARTPVLDRFYETCPNALVDASEQEVGLPASQMGNSEVGHMNLGAGRIVMQDLPRIDAALADGSLAAHPKLATEYGSYSTRPRTRAASSYGPRPNMLRR